MARRRDLDDELARSWHELMGQYHRTVCALDRELESQHGISGSDFEVLQQLYDAGGDCSLRMNDLAKSVHLTQSALSRLVARLEKDGLIRRTMCEDDRRSVFTTITPAGKTVFESARPTQRAVLRDAAAVTSAP
ncbi:DNA-binding transcriptional regulator, MarR family [Jatrophihabitans endophyticus]|uniref:DNA-binding transcriptional regulator, MarR family n=1 Tax=Jatrophihabitans endophyticus TaxID=1206085 RepID=A0A1M5UEQ4_9ACTN|nr:MarR family transcriptional regulator [Jatrophihabitans endophyticus]SHH61316.1 DNA-binding transcriptional regulator, MarR family [Jatrophihabitans endophyticus]